MPPQPSTLKLRQAAEARRKAEAEAALAEELTSILRRLWGYDEAELAAEANRIRANPALAYYLKLSRAAEQAAYHPHFTNFVTVWILVAGALVGVQTELAKPGNVNEPPAMGVLDDLVLAVFTVDPQSLQPDPDPKLILTPDPESRWTSS